MTPEGVRLDEALRILHLANRLGDRGDGISNVCVDLACEQSSAGDDVWVATIPGGFVDLVTARGVQFEAIDFRARDPFSLIRAFLRLRRLVRRIDPQVVHTHTLVATVLARIAVWRGRGRVVATVHNEYQSGVGLMRAAHRVVGVSHAVSEAMVQRRIPRAKVRTVLNGVVGSVRRGPVPLEREGLESPSLIAVGAVSERKGADLLVEAAMGLAGSDGVHTYFVGNIDWQEPVTRAAAAEHGQNVHFLGFRADPRPALAAATVFVLASRRDPAPLVLAEALEMGLPIVAAAVDGVPELLGEPTAGVLVPPNDADALERALRDLLHDADLRTELGRRARKRASALSVSRVCRDYRDVYAELVGGSA